MAYNIKIRTKEGTFEYEKEDLNDLDLILIKHLTYEEMRAEQKKKVLKRENNKQDRLNKRTNR